MKRLLLALAFTALLLAIAPAAEAQTDIGVRAGATLQPDQFHFGFHVRPPMLSEHVRIRPSFELGLGDDLTVAAVNLDVVYEFDTDDGIRPWAGAGPGLSLVDSDRPLGDDDDFRAGLNLVGGLEWGPGYQYLVEARFGFGDIPDLKLTFGWTF